MLAPSHRLCMSFFSFIHGLSHPNRRRADATRCGDCVVVVVVVVRMSQRHAFVAYNCSHHALFRFSSLHPSRFSVIVAAVGERLAAHDIFVSPIYIRKKTACVVPVLVDAAKFGSEDTPRRMSAGKTRVLYEIRMACGLDYSNLVSLIRFHKSRRATRQYFALMMPKVEAR